LAPHRIGPTSQVTNEPANVSVSIAEHN